MKIDIQLNDEYLNAPIELASSRDSLPHRFRSAEDADKFRQTGDLSLSIPPYVKRLSYDDQAT